MNEFVVRGLYAAVGAGVVAYLMHSKLISQEKYYETLMASTNTMRYNAGVREGRRQVEQSQRPVIQQLMTPPSASQRSAAEAASRITVGRS